MHTLILVQNDEKLQKAFKEDKFKRSSDFMDVKRFTVFDETSPEAQSLLGRRMISGAARANSWQRLATKVDMGEWLFIGCNADIRAQREKRPASDGFSRCAVLVGLGIH